MSYHTLIGRSGEVVDVVDPLMRAYGAGYSAFLGEWAVIILNSWALSTTLLFI